MSGELPAEASIPIQQLQEAPEGTFIAESTIPNAGRGLFAGREWQPDEVLGEYRGPILNLEEALALEPAQLEYLYEVTLPKKKGDPTDPPKRYIDGSTAMNHMGLINGIKPRSKTNLRKANVVPRQTGEQIHYHIKRRVPAGKEFLVDYGPAYWSKSSKKR